MSDVSRLAGVSKTTMSRVLNTLELVNRETREKVLGVIRRLDYVPSVIARDLAVGGFDNIFLSSLTSPQLTTVEQPIGLIAREAVGQLIRKIRIRRARNGDIVLATRLVVRESTGAAREERVPR